jgi:predicted nicotinamide N-methyase
MAGSFVRPTALNDGGETSSRSVAVRGRTYVLAQRPSSHNHGHIVWEASIALLDYLASKPKDLAALASGLRVLELGAGCGLVGMALADAGARVVSTDLPSVVEHLKANVAANPPLAGAGKGGSITVLPYAWGDDVAPLLDAAGGGFGLVVGTDVAYSGSLNPLLLQTACAIATASEAARAAAGEKPTRCGVLFANEVRCEEAQRVFEEEAEARFAGGVTRVPDKQVGEQWKGTGMRIFRLRLPRGGKGGDGSAAVEGGAAEGGAGGNNDLDGDPP